MKYIINICLQEKLQRMRMNWLLTQGHEGSIEGNFNTGEQMCNKINERLHKYRHRGFTFVGDLPPCVWSRDLPPWRWGDDRVEENSSRYLYDVQKLDPEGHHTSFCGCMGKRKPLDLSDIKSR